MSNTLSEQNQSQQTIIENWLINWTAEQLDLKTEQIDVNQSFLSYDMNSITAMMLVGDLEDWLDCQLSPTLAWDYPDIKTLAEYLTTITQVSETATSSSTSVNDSAQLLDNIDNLSETQMDDLLASLLAEK